MIPKKKKSNFTKRKTRFESAEKLISAWLNQPKSASHGQSATFAYYGNLLRAVCRMRDGSTSLINFARLVEFNGRRAILKLHGNWRGGGNARHRALSAIEGSGIAVVSISEADGDKLIAHAWDEKRVADCLNQIILASQNDCLNKIIDDGLCDTYADPRNLRCETDDWHISEHNKLAEALGLPDLMVLPPPDFVDFFRQFAQLAVIARTQATYRTQLSFFSPHRWGGRQSPPVWRGDY